MGIGEEISVGSEQHAGAHKVLACGVGGQHRHRRGTHFLKYIHRRQGLLPGGHQVQPHLRGRVRSGDMAPVIAGNIYDAPGVIVVRACIVGAQQIHQQSRHADDNRQNRRQNYENGPSLFLLFHRCSLRPGAHTLRQGPGLHIVAHHFLPLFRGHIPGHDLSALLLLVRQVVFIHHCSCSSP